MRSDVVETSKDRSELARDAGLGAVSPVSVVAGTLLAYGTFAVLSALASALASAVGVDADLSANDWRRLGAGAGIAVAVVLFASYCFGGYVAGRTARRRGLLHGLLVFLLSIVVAAGVGALVGALADEGDGDRLAANLRNVGVPTSGGEWAEVATVAGVASLAAMVAGSLLGGRRGEGWHGRLLTQALDPDVGAEDRLRRRAEATRAEANDRHATAEARASRVLAGGRKSARRDRPAAARAQEPAKRAVVARQPLGPDAGTRRTAPTDDHPGSAGSGGVGGFGAGSAGPGHDRDRRR